MEGERQIINEIGDLGLGLFPINEKIKDNEEEDQKDKQSK